MKTKMLKSLTAVVILCAMLFTATAYAHAAGEKTAPDAAADLNAVQKTESEPESADKKKAEEKPAESDIGEEAEDKPANGLTPPGNLTLVDDLGDKKEAGQQFITLVTKNGNYFYLIIDRDEKGNETVHFLNMVDEQDLFALMGEDEAEAYQNELAEAQAAKEAAEQALAEEKAKSEAEETKPEEKAEKPEKKRVNPAPILLIVVLMAAAAGMWFYGNMKKKRTANTPDPDADYTDDYEDYGAGNGGDESESDSNTDENEKTIDGEMPGKE